MMTADMLKRLGERKFNEPKVNNPAGRRSVGVSTERMLELQAEGLRPVDIAKRLGVVPVTVRSRLSRHSGGKKT